MIFEFKTVDAKRNVYLYNYQERPNYGVAIEWSNNGNIIRLNFSDCNGMIIGCPSQTAEEAVIVFRGIARFSPPGNAAVFDPDGTIRERLTVPELRSDQYKSFKLTDPGIQARPLEFSHPAYDRNNKLLLIVTFDYDWFEARELNAKTGEFTEYVWASRF